MKSGICILWIYFVGTEANAKKYEWSINIKNHKTTRVTYTGPVIPMTQDVESVLKNPNGLMISDKVLQDLLDEEKKLVCNFTIFSRKTVAAKKKAKTATAKRPLEESANNDNTKRKKEVLKNSENPGPGKK
jgi:hypothetical protein